ncbi:unnamed protein product [Meloidogyne enterolobii]|uniref:Uncharacterized protein n=2 Tax=Meloidogyne enterolobii TaxID=390850 RepID=A0A6V7XCU7_MELEN|nr:unnamed protein product [Meloidogyne enterolobii]
MKIKIKKILIRKKINKIGRSVKGVNDVCAQRYNSAKGKGNDLKFCSDISKRLIYHS